MKQIIRRIAALVIGLGLGAVAFAGLESVTHIQDLNAAWPLGSDLASTSDDHIRNIKSALKTDFPNFNGTYTSASAPVFAIPNDTNTGMYGPSADNLAFATGGTQRALVNSTGNWTIAAPSTSANLTLNGIGATAQSQLNLLGGTNGSASLLLQDGQTGTRQWVIEAGNPATGNLRIRDATAAADRVVINNNGGVTVNAPSGGQHEIDSFGQSTAIVFGFQASGTTAGWLQVNDKTNANTVRGYMGFGSSLFTGAALADFGIASATGTLRLSANGGGSTHLAITNAGAIQGLGPVATALVDMTPDTGTFTGTFTGFTAGITGTCTWTRSGKLVTLTFPANSVVTGTSNATAFTMTGLPAAIQPATLNQFISLPVAGVQNNGTLFAGAVQITAASGTLTFWNSNGVTVSLVSTWISSGSKGFNTAYTGAYTISYLLN